VVAEVGVYVDQVIVSNTFSGSCHNWMLLKDMNLLILPFGADSCCLLFFFFNPVLMYIFCVSVPF
jgi:hypothetical protein